MTRSERRLAIRTASLGVLLTLLIATLNFFGSFDSLERWLYDERARHFQHFLRPPTDQLVHVDIDDQSLDAIRVFPWPRSMLAEVVDEIRRAGAKALAFDVIFNESQEPKVLLDREAATQPVVVGEVDHDALLADAIRRFGTTLVPASLRLDPIVHNSTYDLVRVALVEDLELTPDEVAQRLATQSQKPGADFATAVKQEYPQAQLDAMRQRVSREFGRARAADHLTYDQLRVALLPRTPPAVRDSALLLLLRGEAERWKAQNALRRFARPITPDLPPLLPTYDAMAPIELLSASASASGFVDYLPNADGVVRTMPLWVTYHDQAYPQAGLALACMMLGINPADPQQVKIDEAAVTLLPAGRPPIVIPVRTVPAQRLSRVASTVMYIPWFGGRDWGSMFAASGRDPHLLIGDVWQVCLSRRSILTNNAAVDQAIEFPLKVLYGDERVLNYRGHHPAQDDFAARQKLIQQVIGELESSGTLQQYAEIKPDELTAEDKGFLASVNTLRDVAKRNSDLSQALIRQEDWLRQKLTGKAVLLGYVATAAAASDFVPTSLHPRCPGVIVHGAIFNGIMSGEMWRHAPAAIDPMITLAIGLLSTLAVTLFTPWRAIIGTAAMLLAFLAVNAVVLFDYGNVIVNAAGSIVVAAVVWSACTLLRFVVERVERARITGRFRSYVDPALVDYIVENPDKEKELLAGQVRELTVVFSDLAGYTTISERLGRGIVKFLNEYFDTVVPIIRRRNGYVNKFIGDGILFVFGAPLENPRHARDAVDTVLEMQQAVEQFNVRLKARDLPPVRMRTGITTSELVVGDAGPRERSDYTVLGDGVNLASRLETANKQTGTENLISQRTAELIGEEFLLRPIGRLRVVGKVEHVTTFEVLCRMEQGTDAIRARAALTSRMVESYQASHFDECLAACERLEGAFGPDPLVTLYRRWCTRNDELLAGDRFEGQIALSEK